MSRWIAIAGVLFAAAGCSSGGTTATSPAPAASSPAAAPGGLVGAIDQARVTAVCADAREAQTVLSVGGSAVTDPLAAAAGLLERPPVDAQAAAAAGAIRRDLAAGHANLALTEALSFCHAHGG
jgi:hypothetical protein